MNDLALERFKGNKTKYLLYGGKLLRSEPKGRGYAESSLSVSNQLLNVNK